MTSRWSSGTFRLLGLLLAVATCAAQAQSGPLSLPELRRCAAQVQELRTESSRIMRQHARNEQRRETYNQRSEALRNERASLSAEELRAGLDFHDRNQRHQDELKAFNTEIEQFKHEIIAVNVLKRNYEQTCASRPYRRSELDALPEAEREAMRRGLSDVQVPYLDPAALPR